MTILRALCSARLCWNIWLKHNNVEDKTVGDRLDDPEAKALSVALTATPANVEDKTFAGTISDAGDETEVHTLAVTLPDVVAENVAIY